MDPLNQKNTMRNVRLLTEKDIGGVVDYFLKASPEFLRGMGADIEKLPSREAWHTIIATDLKEPLHKRKFFYVIWEIDGVSIGHSNINTIQFGEEAIMHLHIWKPDNRSRGNGLYFIKESLKHYFETFQLKKIVCEPYAENPAPNKTLVKAGFTFIKQYETTPGWINFHQTVNRWELSAETFKKLNADVT